MRASSPCRRLEGQAEGGPEIETDDSCGQLWVFLHQGNSTRCRLRGSSLVGPTLGRKHLLFCPARSPAVLCCCMRSATEVHIAQTRARKVSPTDARVLPPRWAPRLGCGRADAFPVPVFSAKPNVVHTRIRRVQSSNRLRRLPTRFRDTGMGSGEQCGSVALSWAKLGPAGMASEPVGTRGAGKGGLAVKSGGKLRPPTAGCHFWWLAHAVCLAARARQRATRARTRAARTCARASAPVRAACQRFRARRPPMRRRMHQQGTAAVDNFQR